MRDPHVRFCERLGGVISRAYSTLTQGGVPGMGTGLEVKVLCGASW
jgi:hypothetical protein